MTEENTTEQQKQEAYEKEMTEIREVLKTIMDLADENEWSSTLLFKTFSKFLVSFKNEAIGSSHEVVLASPVNSKSGTEVVYIQSDLEPIMTLINTFGVTEEIQDGDILTFDFSKLKGEEKEEDPEDTNTVH